MKIGFIGVGQMGRHMAKRILDSGFSLIVHDIRKEEAIPLLEKGAAWGDFPKELAGLCDVVISSLPTPKIVEQVVYGPNGLREGWKKGDVYIDMSTNSPTVIRRIASDASSMGVSVLDAPVSGGIKGAEAGTLTIMVGGEADCLEKVRNVLGSMGKNIFHVGDVGCGNIVKLVNNMLAIACTSITAEGFALGAKAGIDPGILWEIVKISTGNNWSLQQYPNTVFKRNFEPGFKISLAHKDMGLALDLGQEYSVALPFGTMVKESLSEAIAAGLSDKHIDALILLNENNAGITVQPDKGKGPHVS